MFGPQSIDAALAAGRTELEALQELLPAATALARPPVSGFSVGAVGLGASGAAYCGANIEFPGLPLAFSIHAEQCLLVNLLHAGERQLRRLVVSAAPCGHCRQFLAELTHADDLELSFGEPSRRYSLRDLLPQRFGPGDLLNGGAARQPLLLEAQHWPLEWTAVAWSVLEGLSEGRRALAEEALRGASASYCPYSRHPSGVALLTQGGGTCRGEYIESAAFNPSLSPLHTALIAAVTQGLQDWSEVRDVVLVECGGARVGQEAVLRAGLQAIAPAATLLCLHARHC